MALNCCLYCDVLYVTAHGADVLFVTSPHLPSLSFLDVDTSRGKRTTQLDLNDPADAETLRSLVRDADVFLQSYRPHGLAEHGFGPEDSAALRPGIVHACLTGFAPGGPWGDVKSVSFSPCPLPLYQRMNE